jgi:hypothetical protein
MTKTDELEYSRINTTDVVQDAVIYSHCNHLDSFWACRIATQTSSSSLMNFVWKYALLIFNVTNEVQYRSGCMQNGCVLMDSEPNQRRIIRHCRFVSATGNPCLGTSLDYDVEAVRVSYMKMFILRRPPVLQWFLYVSPS